MKPRASASFCHWPNDTSTPPGQVGPSCVSRPRGKRADDVVRAGAIDRGRDRRLVVEARQRRRRRRCARRGTRSGRNPGTRRPGVRATLRPACARARRRRPGCARAVGWYSRHSSLTSVVLPAPFSPTIATTVPGGSSQVDVVEHQARRCRDRRTTRARSGCRRSMRRGHRCVRVPPERRRVVLEPGQAPRAVEPDAAQEADLADRRADVGREARARREHEQHVARPAAQADDTNTTAPT